MSSRTQQYNLRIVLLMTTILAEMARAATIADILRARQDTTIMANQIQYNQNWSATTGTFTLFAPTNAAFDSATDQFGNWNTTPNAGWAQLNVSLQYDTNQYDVLTDISGNPTINYSMLCSSLHRACIGSSWLA